MSQNIVICGLKSGIEELEETLIARQLLGKNVSTTTTNNGTIVERRNFLWGHPEVI
jgi:hypothetical protein